MYFDSLVLVLPVNTWFGEQWKNYCTISSPNHIDIFKSSNHIIISPYHDFTITPFVPKKNDSPLDHLTIWITIQKSLHHFATKPYWHIKTIVPYHHFTISWFHHFVISPSCYKREPIHYNTNKSDRLKNAKR